MIFCFKRFCLFLQNKKMYSFVLVFTVCIFATLIVLFFILWSIFIKMLFILKKRSAESCCINWAWFSLSFKVFKELIDNGDLDSQQKEKYILLYKRGVYIRRIYLGLFLFCFICIMLASIIWS